MFSAVSALVLVAAVVLIVAQYDQHKTYLTSQIERPWYDVYYNEFGTRVASSGSLVAVSTKPLYRTDSFDSSEDADDEQLHDGCVYLFDTQVSNMKPVALIKNPQTHTATAFGEDGLAISTNQLFIGDSKYNNNMGCVYIYESESVVYHNWTLIQTLYPNSLSPYQFFGKNLDVSKNGSMLGITSSGSHSFMGSVFIYININNTYTLYQELTSYDDDYKYEYEYYYEDPGATAADDDGDDEGDEDDDEDDRDVDDENTYFTYITDDTDNEEQTGYYEFGKALYFDDNDQQLVVSQVRNDNRTASVNIFKNL